VSEAPRDAVIGANLGVDGSFLTIQGNTIPLLLSSPVRLFDPNKVRHQNGAHFFSLTVPCVLRADNTSLPSPRNRLVLLFFPFLVCFSAIYPHFARFFSLLVTNGCRHPFLSSSLLPPEFGGKLLKEFFCLQVLFVSFFLMSLFPSLITLFEELFFHVPFPPPCLFLPHEFLMRSPERDQRIS